MDKGLPHNFFAFTAPGTGEIAWDNMSICQTCFGLDGEWTLRARRLPQNDPKRRLRSLSRLRPTAGIRTVSCLAHSVLSAPLCYFVTPATTNLAVSTIVRSRLNP